MHRITATTCKQSDYQQVEELQLDVTRKFVKIFFNRIANYDDLASDLTKTDMQLSLFIVHSFGKLFDAWQTYPVAKKALEKHLFHDIYTEMLRSFSEGVAAPQEETHNTDELKAECDLGGDEKFSVTDNDLQSAYDGNSTAEHTKTLKIFQNAGGLDGIDSRAAGTQSKLVVSKCNDLLDVKPHSEFDRNFAKVKKSHPDSAFLKLSPVINGSEAVAVECVLCGIVVEGLDWSRVTDHYTSFDHVNRKYTIFRRMKYIKDHGKDVSVLGVRKIYINNKGGNFYCLLCCETFKSGALNVHENTTKHKKLNTILTDLLSKELFTWVKSEKCQGFKCDLCFEDYDFVTEAVQHCKSETHKNIKQRVKLFLQYTECCKLKPAQKNGKNKEFLVFQLGAPSCLLCPSYLQSTANIQTHFAGNNHKSMEKCYREILKDVHIRKLFFP